MSGQRFYILCIAVSHLAWAGAWGDAPDTVEALWAGFDPQKDPLETEVVRRWSERQIVYQLVRFKVADFKGRPAKVAGYYAIPPGGGRRPAILQFHGAGQRAEIATVKYWAELGYAALAINWGGHIMEQKTTPNTDWGQVDGGFQGPRGRFKEDLTPDKFTLGNQLDPRNSNWYLAACAGRRGLTFLEDRPEVDREKIGVTGYGMGGKLATMVAIDARVKAGGPEAGGTGFLHQDLWGLPKSARPMKTGLELYQNTIGAEAYWPHIQCPVLFMGSCHDVDAPTEHIPRALGRAPHRNTRMILAPHRSTPDTRTALPLWFDAQLKNNFTFPRNSKSALLLKQPDGIPLFKVYPDRVNGLKIDRINVYFGYDRDPRVRFWRSVGASKKGSYYEAKCPVMDVEEPLFAFANVTYGLKRDVYIPGRTEPVKELTVASAYQVAHPGRMKDAGVQPSEKPERMIDDFKRGLTDWHLSGEHTPHHWMMSTRKLCDPKWVGPKGAQLSFAIYSTARTQLGVVLKTNQGRDYNRRPQKTYVALLTLSGKGWERVALSSGNFISFTRDAPVLRDWDEITEFVIEPANRALERIKRENRGAVIKIRRENWQGERPEIQQLQWVGGAYGVRKKPYLP